jgi:hypothetical protein
MENQNQNKPEITPMQFLTILGCVAVIGIMVLINAHWRTIERWIETLFWVALVAGVLFGLAMLFSRGNLPNPFDRYGRYRQKMDKKVNRIRGGRDDEELSDYDRELIDRIQNYYRDKISKLYDPD